MFRQPVAILPGPGRTPRIGRGEAIGAVVGVSGAGCGGGVVWRREAVTAGKRWGLR